MYRCFAPLVLLTFAACGAHPGTQATTAKGGHPAQAYLGNYTGGELAGQAPAPGCPALGQLSILVTVSDGNLFVSIPGKALDYEAAAAPLRWVDFGGMAFNVELDASANLVGTAEQGHCAYNVALEKI